VPEHADLDGCVQGFGKVSDNIKISVITWDGGFRENFHTVDFFSSQTFSKDAYEFIWVNYYSDVAAELKDKVGNMGNGRTICLNGEGEWHLGKCLNEGIRQSRGELIIIPDGDIVVEPNLLEETWETHGRIDDLVLYFRRWDELEAGRAKDKSLQHLRQVTKLRGPNNYGGCLTIKRPCLAYVKGYEEHPVFAGSGASGRELYTRLKNAGFPIMWHPTHKLYHPWHSGTLGGPREDIRREQQFWVIKQRDLAVDVEANKAQVDMYLRRFKANNS
jgi:hypothetical protein